MFCLAIVGMFFVWSAISPYDRFTWYLESFPVIIVIPLLGITYQRFKLTNLLYALIALHCIILLIGGHYTYAQVPIFDVIRDHWHLSRNHYDRVGHFFQGFVPAIAIRELLLRTSPLTRGKWLIAIILFGCLGISASYELLEWGVAELTGEAAEAFLGTQGDPWDTQKDMFFALIGTLASIITLSRWHDAFLKKIL
jgi:putative membrane protein